MKTSCSYLPSAISCLIGVICLVILFAASACGSATPTRVSTPTTVALGQASPTVVAPPTVAATSTVAPTTTITATVPTSETKVAQFVSPTSTPRPRTPTPAVAAPGPLSGHIAYSVRFPGVDFVHRQVWVVNADGSGEHQILERSRWPAFSKDGTQLAYYELDTGMFLADGNGGGARHALTGPVCCFSWSPDGNWIVYAESIKISQPGGPIKKLRVSTAFNSTKDIIELAPCCNGPTYSPDGTHVAYGGCESNSSTCGVFVIGADGGVPRHLTTDAGGNPDYSPRGDRLVYHAGVGDGRIQIFIVNADGTGRKQLTSGKGNDGQPVWSRDGTRIFYRSDQDGTEWAIYVMNADGSGKRKLVSSAPVDQDFWGWDTLSLAP
jgi:Tol biopolymer transport system component